MSNRATRRLMRQVQKATGLSKKELGELLEAEGLSGEAEQDVPTPAAGPVNPLIRAQMPADGMIDR